MKNINYIRAGFSVLMAVYGVICAHDVENFHMLDRVNLIAHEAGHLLFSYFGEFVHVLGGTISQLFVPVSFTVYFFARREFYSSAVTLFWTGQNFFWISVYVKDSQAMDLPMISVGQADDVIHDWNYILTRIGLIRWDQAIGNMVYGAGIVIIILSLVWGFYHSIDREEDVV